MVKSFVKADLSENITMNECQEPVSDGFISFFNPFHISALLCNYSLLKEESYGNFMNDCYYLMQDLDNLWAVYEENKWLRQELSKVDQKDALIESYQKEIAELKGLMGQTVDKKFQKKYATIINRNPETYSNQITLNIGTKDGVSLDNAVISNSGLIGKIINVSNFSSTVKLLTSDEISNKISIKIKSGQTARMN